MTPLQIGRCANECSAGCRLCCWCRGSGAAALSSSGVKTAISTVTKILFWAVVKVSARLQYTTATTSANIRTQLDKAFQNVGSATAQGCIDAANKNLSALKSHLIAMDTTSKSSDSCASSDSHSDIDSDSK
ncbi:hypothetical protein PybrP1_006212 [[Pythium] brassicae (nom. inval.)]|nr:hypothetical protein PybrP1_006212 [[Pythium] brassicae (nom. inval.)]